MWLRVLLVLVLPMALSACLIVPIPIPVPSPSPVTTSSQGHPVTRAPDKPTPARFGPAPATSRCAPPKQATALRRAILSEVNRARRAAGLRAVVASAQLDAIAQGHACDNAARDSYSHYGSDGAELTRRLRRGGFHYHRAAENTGLGFGGDPARVMAFWMNSPGHRANILNRGLRQLGLGVATSDSGKMAWVLVLGTPW